MTKKKKIKLFIICAIVLAVIAGGLIILRKLMNKPTDTMNNVYKVEVEKYENIIEISGTVAAAQEQTLQARSAGTVLAVYVKAGDHVKKGDVILQLDDTTEQYNLAKHDYDMATTRISGSARELTLKETQRLSLLQKIEDRKVVATFDGVIADLDVAVGDSLEAKDSVGTIVNIDYLTAEVEITETDVAKLQKGQDVELTFAAYDKTVMGYVESWPAIGELTSRGATIVKAKIRIDEYPEVILPYFSFTGKIQIEKPVNNIIVSRYAIGYEDKEAYVVLAKGNEKRSVKVVPYGRDNVKILEGLKGGEMLLQQSKEKSGQNRNRNNGGTGNGNNNGNSRSGNNNSGNNGGNFGGMPMGGGMPPR